MLLTNVYTYNGVTELAITLEFDNDKKKSITFPKDAPKEIVAQILEEAAREIRTMDMPENTDYIQG